MEELKWYGWKDISIPNNLIGETIKKGSGIFEKEYTYINIPPGYGYDNYCFLLSSSIVHESSNGKEHWFSICHDMKIELFYSPDAREEGKRYKRYKLTGYELFENIFDSYETDFIADMVAREKKKAEEKEKRDKKTYGKIVCGIYKGNVYSELDPRYRSENIVKAYFYTGSSYSNSKFSKVQNVKREFVIAENVSKQTYIELEELLNKSLSEYMFYVTSLASVEAYIVNSPITLDNFHRMRGICTESIEEIKEHMHQLVKARQQQQ
jgi:hypothetical protein